METVGNVMLEEVHQLRWCTNVFANSEMGGAPCGDSINTNSYVETVPKIIKSASDLRVDVGRCSVEGRVAEAMEVVVYGLVCGCGGE
eukprot:scaffold11377_cov110-Alexandrium_tamarense.AAC.1